MMTIAIGIMEFGLLYTSFSTTTASSRSGARLAATAYSQAGTSTTEQRNALDAIAAASAADLKVLNNAVPVGMTIYRVDPASRTGAPAGGFPGTELTGGCTSRCIRFRWDDASQEMRYVSGSWTDAVVCGFSVDSIGVFVEASHRSITGLLGSNRRVTGHTTMRLEPLPTEQCA